MKPLKILLLFILILSVFSMCHRENSSTTERRKKRMWQKENHCSTDNDCVAVDSSIECCSGCGSSIFDFTGVSRKGARLRLKYIDSLNCSEKSCPLVNCAVTVKCVDAVAVCASGRCAIKRQIRKTCTDSLPSSLHWRHMNSCESDSDCFVTEDENECKKKCPSPISKIIAVNREGKVRKFSWKLENCKPEIPYENPTCENPMLSETYAECISGKCELKTLKKSTDSPMGTPEVE
ncbi:MAG: hypothetical protein JXR95_12260 [Deltaproteobacteria bacterium]|nr:hypothetical protein [Deltaproteobacteria bacterium]